MTTLDLSSALSLLRSTLEATADGLLVVDAEGKMAGWNGRFVEIWRIPKEVIESREDAKAVAFVLDQLVDPAEFQRKISELYSSPQAESHDILRFKDGRTIERLSRPQWLDGQIVGRVWSFRDVTERKEAEEAMALLLLLEKEARTQAEAAVAKREEFLSLAAHELRTPLTALNLAVSSLCKLAQRAQSTCLSQEFLDALSASERQVARMNQLVSNLVEVARFSGKKGVVLQRGQGDLVSLVRSAMARVEEEFAQAARLLRLEVAPGLVLGGSFDCARIQDAVASLLKNALRYGRGKPVRVVVTREGEGGNLGQVAVIDEGIGVSSEERSRIFELYERAESARHYGGLGLGLYLARRFVEAHGGTIDVESIPDRGSCFVLKVPLR